MYDLILASSSPYREQQLASIGYRFRTVAPEVAECPHAAESASSMAARFALLKARTVAAKFPKSIVVGSDQTGECKETLLVKPLVFDVALDMLLNYRGQTVSFFTAVVVLKPQQAELRDVVRTDVQFRDFTQSEAINYLSLDQPLDCAGAIKSEAHGSLLFKSVRSEDPTALMGLPLIRTAEFLRASGINPLERADSKTPQSTGGLELE